MKHLKKILLFTLLAFAAQVQAQFYGINVEALCWQTPSGTDSTIYAAYISAAATTRPTKIHYFVPISSGTGVTSVTVSGGTLSPGPCSEQTNVDSTEANIQNTIGYFIVADTIPANSAWKVVITNEGTTTHDIRVDGVPLRLYPGEQYRWEDYFDRNRNVWVYNPEIIIPAGISGSNNTRKVVFPK
ncbi:MAG: hypothetical protein D6706_05275 [Chloroflexi bacterium]|nr:MAG: hypothetical protein D6706_05275 [Chloroflexota bacterium]